MQRAFSLKYPFQSQNLRPFRLAPVRKKWALFKHSESEFQLV